MRRSKPQLHRIDIDELFDNSSNRGMLSFLERAPEDARARLRDKQIVDEADSHRLDPVGDSLPVGYLHPVGNLPPVGNLLENTPLESAPLPFPMLENDPGRIDQAFAGEGGRTHPEGGSPLRVTHPLGKSLPARSKLSNYAGVNASAVSEISGHMSPLGVTYPEVARGHAAPSSAGPSVAIRPLSNLPSGQLSPVIDGSVVGRRQKIRRATVAQDGHSSGEQLLYQSLWNAATAETSETRLICIGYNGMSSLCKLDRSNCKKNIQTLVEKLSVQVAQTYESASSTGTTYRVFSYREILRRREAAGMVWVVRTSGVRFVHPLGDLPTTPVRDLPPGPLREAPSGAKGEIPTPPVGETHTPLGSSKNQEGITTSATVRLALNNYGTVDDDALKRLITKCRQHAPDCTGDEIAYFVHEKGTLTKARDSRIQNPIGFLIDATAKCFAGESFRVWRQAREPQLQNTEQGREVPSLEEQIMRLEFLLEVLPNHEQAEENRKMLTDLKKQQAEDRGSE